MKAAQLAQLLFVIVASVAAYSFVRAARHDEQLTSCSALCELGPAYAGRNRLAPDFELTDMSGTPVRFSSWWGRTIVLNFWTQSCEPCKKELPSLAELASMASEHGVVVVTVSADEGPEAVRQMLRQTIGTPEPPFAVLFDPELEVIQDKFGTTKYPETWIIDEDRVIRARFDGDRNWSSSLALEVIDNTQRPLSCPVAFQRGRPVGPHAAVCEPVGG